MNGIKLLTNVTFTFDSVAFCQLFHSHLYFETSSVILVKLLKHFVSLVDVILRFENCCYLSDMKEQVDPFP